jgi:serine/threonine protein kinase
MTRYRTQLLLLAAGLLVACYFGMRSGETFRHVIVPGSGQIIIVDGVWQQEKQVWVHQSGAIHAYPVDEVTQGKTQAEPIQRRGLAQLQARLWQWRWKAFILLNTHKPGGRQWSSRQLDYLLATVAGVLILVTLFLGKLFGRRQSTPSTSQAPSIVTDSHGGDTPMDLDIHPDASAEEADQAPKEQIVAFFLQLYQAQCAPGRQTKASFREITGKGPHGNTIYELKVPVQGKTHLRRMSIGTLGPSAVGSSLCFFVIYDIHLVVKLPRTPIHDYAHYIECIDKERHIATLLGGVPVIVPRVTPILENVHRFADHETLSSDAVERRYIAWMRRNPAFQRYLKVGPSFAFFMELASHHFLRHVFDDMHLIKARIAEEIRDHGHLIWKPHAFIGRYGAGAQPVCAQLQGVYQSCRRSLDLPTHPHNPTPAVTDYQYKKDFLAALGAHIHGRVQAAPLDEMAPTMDSLIGEQEGVLNHYRRTLKGYLRKTLFLHHRQQIGALVANTLHLVTWLNGRRIALRDLKPENLLVVGDTDDAATFLKRRELFRLGLIDLETAAARNVEGDTPGLLAAPKPGGTPLYATPSHFVTYEMLGRIYSHPFFILMEQDWYAAIAICFKAVTGEHLFNGTAGLFPAMVEMLSGADPDDPEGFGNLFSKLSWVFWSNARMEFHEKLRQHRATLSKVNVNLAPQCAEALKRRIDRRRRSLNKEMTALMNQHAKLGEVAHHLQLSTATSEQIRLLRTTWEMDATADSKQSFLLSDRFRELEGVTQNLEILEQGQSLLESWKDGIDLLPLMKVLFAQCLSVMYKGDWKGLGHRRIDWHEALMDEPSYTQTL